MTAQVLVQADHIQLRLEQTSVLKNLNLSVAQGECLVVAGPNGAGKSSLLQMLAGMYRPSEGCLRIGNRETRGWSRQEWTGRVAYLPQLQRLDFPLSVRESLELARLSWPVAQVAGGDDEFDTVLEHSLRLWELTALADRPMDQLSGGEQQRCQLARSWLQLQRPECGLWLLDEPMSALDVHFQFLLLERINEAQSRGKAVVLVLHDVRWLVKMATQVLLLKSGEPMPTEAKPPYLTPQLLSEAFDVTLKQAELLLL